METNNNDIQISKKNMAVAIVSVAVMVLALFGWCCYTIGRGHGTANSNDINGTISKALQNTEKAGSNLKEANSEVRSSADSAERISSGIRDSLERSGKIEKELVELRNIANECLQLNLEAQREYGNLEAADYYPRE